MQIKHRFYANVFVALIILGFIFPVLISAQQQPVSPPGNVEEIKTFGQRAGEIIKEKLPGTLENIWKEEVLPLWQKMYEWAKINIWPKVEGIFKTVVKPKVQEEYEKRKPVVKEEFQKEKEEMKSEVPQVTKSLWEKFKELLQ